MALLRKDGGDHIVYEHQQKGVLVAVSKENQKSIKQFWKKYKGKQDLPKDTVSAYQFVLDEEMDSLKIDFSKEHSYLIRDLTKFN